ncbi:hypothetical protein ASG87_12670 [Frateuria sp. Soil773]|uniref:GNAT family N-acetyltransferase n=1 Tax=Frateuria sp. Soil773 TaxID=1736407 RepID=UPI0006F58139|nr:GNAT family N-acetyltransferase [Frateuria sp. Soil773]KRF00543.1 hypothetical protein ASG87_12670 [Frateuria sp. Soil773]
MQASPAAFPAGRADRLHAPPALAGREFALRPAVAGDLAFLRRLYGQVRAAELAAVPWPDAVKEQFLDSQFALQHRHYLVHFADADFLLLERAGEAVGRLYLQRRAPDYLIVDISLLDDQQGQGVGGALIDAVQQRAAAEGCGVRLHVEMHNERARRLYERLGFAPLAIEGAHRLMRWPGASLS